jgi:hypothetical protein
VDSPEELRAAVHTYIAARDALLADAGSSASSSAPGVGGRGVLVEPALVGAALRSHLRVTRGVALGNGVAAASGGWLGQRPGGRGVRGGGGGGLG